MKIFIGYNRGQDSVYQVAKASILKYCDADIQPLIKPDLKHLCWKEDELASTEFTYTRFLVPHLMDYKGWALFVDCDFLFLDDVSKLFELADDQYAVMCVKHDYYPQSDIKMDNKIQHSYPRKNWSSLILWNCSHVAHKKLTLDLINNSTGKYLHRFSWIRNKHIGSISHEWNWLINWYHEPEDGKPKALHYTEGGPWITGKSDPYDVLWLENFKTYINSSNTKYYK